MTSPLPRTLSVLLVEDSPADGRLLIEALKPAITAGELVVQTVKSLARAIETLKSSDFSCVLLDLGLPDGRGVENVRALREVDRKSAILVLTGIADEKLASEALRLGAQDYLVKGESDGEQLIKQLRRAVQRNRQTYALEGRRDQAFFEASHDELTLLPNAALFADRARMQLAGARAGGQPLVIGLLRVEGIEAAGIRYGVDVSQRLLLKIGQLLGENLASGRTLARVGEHEFALLGAAHTTAAELGEWLQHGAERIAALRRVDDCEIAVQALTALAPASTAEDTPDSLLERARQQLDAQPLPPLEPSQHPRRVAVTAVQSPLATAQWQPWVDASSQRCVGLQLLTAGDSATTAPSLLRTVDLLERQWRDWAGVYFAPDLVALSLPSAALEPDIAGVLTDRLSHCGVPAARLQLEIGEAVFREIARHGEALNRLRSAGFRLVLAGDGSVETTLRDLSAFPLDGYKLSASVVRLLVEEGFQGPARRLVSAVCGAAQALNATVIASGVDSQECAAALQLIGLRYLQGRALLPPLETEAVPMAWERPVAPRK